MNIASIDIGTNTVLLLIANISTEDRKIKTLLSEYRMPRLGRGLVSGGAIAEDRIRALLDVLNEYKTLIHSRGCTVVLAKGTSALRKASNGREIVELVFEKTGIQIDIIDGTQEAELSYLGAVSASSPKGNYMVIDIGGGSTEIISGRGNSVDYRYSFEIGVVNLTEKYFHHDPPEQQEIDAAREEIHRIFSPLGEKIFNPDKAIAVAGTPTSLACMKLGKTEYSDEAAEAVVLDRNDLKQLFGELSTLNSHDILDRYKSVVSGREDLITGGTLILNALSEILALNEFTVSTRSIRHGAIIKHLKNHYNES